MTENIYSKIEADLHIHSVSSGHAFSTISEIITSAKNKGLKTIAITDHGPALPGAAHLYHFSNLKILGDKIDEINVLKGVEANIIDDEGNLDIPTEIQNNLDIVLATFHTDCGYIDRGEVLNTEVLIKSLQKNHIDIIAHPGNQLFKLDYDKVAKYASENNIIIEFNNSSYLNSGNRFNSRDLDFELAQACRKYNNKVIVSSDSHFASDIAKVDLALQLLSEIKIKSEQILNLNNENLLIFLKNKR